MGEFSIRDMSDDDLPEVLDLMRESLGESERLPRTPELFRWKHYDNPFGRSILLVAETDGRIVGLRAFMRWGLVDTDANLLRCVRPVDTATHPNYQRRGIFRALTEEAVEVARRDAVDLIFNTPNPQSGQGYLKMGWRSVGQIGVLVRPLRFALGSRAAIDLEEVLGSGSVVVEALPPARKPRGLRTPRTDSYLHWRFNAHPTVSYTAFGDAAGAVVAHAGLRNGRVEVIVADLLGDAAAPLRSVLRSARASYAVGWFSRGSAERRTAVRAGMLPVPGVRALTLVARPLTDTALEVADLQAWDLAMSDLELL